MPSEPVSPSTTIGLLHETAGLAQEGDEGEEREAENGEMVALDARKQVDAELLELVSPDAFEHRRAGCREIGIEKCRRERPHGEAGGIDRVEEDLFVAH